MALGWRSVAWGLKRISSQELNEWQAFYRLEPFGFEANIMGNAIVASTVYNMLKDKSQKALDWTDFMPQEKKVQSTEEMIEIAHMMTMALGGEDKRKCQQ